MWNPFIYKTEIRERVSLSNAKFDGFLFLFFWFKRVLDRGPEQRESKLSVLCLLITIILISYKMINYGEPSQPKLETELSKFDVFTSHKNFVSTTWKMHMHIRQIWIRKKIENMRSEKLQNFGRFCCNADQNVHRLESFLFKIQSFWFKSFDERAPRRPE